MKKYENIMFGVSPLTDTIYAGELMQTELKKGKQIWKEGKIDVTEKVITAIADHLYLKAQETGFYEYVYENVKGFKITMKCEKIKNVENLI